MKFQWRKYKKWDELTQAEKIEHLKMEIEYPNYTWSLLVLVLAMVVIVNTYQMDISIAKINDIYNQTGMTMTDSTSEYTLDQYVKLAEVTRSFIIVILAIAVAGLAWMFWHHWKWRKFMKQIEYKKAKLFTEKQLKKEWEAKK